MAATAKTIPFAVPAQLPRVPAPVTQKQLIELILLRNALRQRQEQLAFLENELKASLEAGAEVEEGVHIAELKENFRRNVAWREVSERLADRLYGDGRGEGYCEQVLASTKPTRTTNLHVA